MDGYFSGNLNEGNGDTGLPVSNLRDDAEFLLLLDGPVVVPGGEENSEQARWLACLKLQESG